MVTIVTVYEQGLLRALETDGESWNRKVADEVMAEAIVNCPTRSGNLAASHGVTQNRSATGFTFGHNVYNDYSDEAGKPIALYVHEGTGMFGPRGVPIVPLHTKEKRYMHIPPHMLRNPWIWTNLRGSGKKRRSKLAPDFDPFAHAEQVDGQEGQPWLEEAGDTVAHRHGAV